MSVDQQFTRLSDKLQHLLKQYNRMKREHEQMQKELSLLQQKERGYHERILELQQQISILRVSAGSLPEKDRKDFEKQVNSYIKEIDKCISYLSQ